MGWNTNVIHRRTPAACMSMGFGSLPIHAMHEWVARCTRCSVRRHQQGGHVTYVTASESSRGHLSTIASLASLPHHCDTMAWEIRFSNSRQLPYFHNNETGDSKWEKPSELSDEDVKKLPGYNIITGIQNRSQPSQQSEQVRASHILAKHTGSRRPSSWKQVCLGNRRHPHARGPTMPFDYTLTAGQDHPHAPGSTRPDSSTP